MILSKFKKKPDWQHRDPAVRRTAVDNIDDVATLKQLIANDKDAIVRRAAVQKLNELNVLQELSQEDSDPEIRECAQYRLTQLLTGQKEALSLTARLDWLEQSQDAKLLELLALKAKESELRLAAIAKIDRDAVLGDVASQDALPALRLAAIEKIQQKSTLERVYKATRSSDKQVSRIAKEKLDRLLEQEQRPLKIQAEGEAICKRLELLGRGKAQWTQEQLEFSQLQLRWQAIVSEVQTALLERYQQAESAFLAVWHDYEMTQRQQQEQQQLIDSQRENKKVLCEQAESLLADLMAGQEAHTSDHADHLGDWQGKLNTWQTQWRELPALSDNKDEKQWQQRFENTLTSIRRLSSELQKTEQLKQSLQKLCQKAENALTRGIKSSKIKELKEAWHSLAITNPDAAFIRDDVVRFQGLLQQLEQHLAQQVAQRDHWIGQLETELQRLETALEKGELHTAIDLEKNSLELLDKITGLPAAHYKSLESRLHESVTKIREWRSWENWGVLNERKLLCEQAEQLLLQGADDPEKTAHSIRKMQEEWKKLGSISNSQGLWKRFNEACNKAYDICQVYFDQQAKQRQENFQAKKKLCQDLQHFVDQIDWGKPDWREMNRKLRLFKKDWHNIGATDRKDRKFLKERYDQLAGNLESKLNSECTANNAFREQLIQEAKAAQEIEDVAVAINLTKSIQARWKVTVPGQRKAERDLWERFRKTCDVVFERLKQEEEARKLADEQQKAARVQNQKFCIELCKEVEQFCQLTGNDLAHAFSRLKEIQTKWREASHLYPTETKALDKNFKIACERVKLLAQLQLLTTDQMQLNLLHHKAALCHELEMAKITGSLTPELLDQTQARWAEWADLESPQDNAVMTQRFEQAKLGMVSVSDEARKAKELLCLRLELLAEVKSPPEMSPLLLSLKVAQLSEALSGSQKDKPTTLLDLEREWYLTPPYGSEYADELERRFFHAKAVLIDLILNPPPPSSKKQADSQEGAKKSTDSASANSDNASNSNNPDNSDNSDNVK